MRYIVGWLASLSLIAMAAVADAQQPSRSAGPPKVTPQPSKALHGPARPKTRSFNADAHGQLNKDNAYKKSEVVG